MMRVDRCYGLYGLGFVKYNGSDKNVKLFNEKHLFSLANDTGLSAFIYLYKNLSNAMLV